jgi:hypothetical protein
MGSPFASKEQKEAFLCKTHHRSPRPRSLLPQFTLSGSLEARPQHPAALLKALPPSSEIKSKAFPAKPKKKQRPGFKINLAEHSASLDSWELQLQQVLWVIFWERMLRKPAQSNLQRSLGTLLKQPDGFCSFFDLKETHRGPLADLFSWRTD